MCGLTEADHPSEAWQRFFDPRQDVIGIKINPVGHKKGRRDAVESISYKEVILEAVRNLREIGTAPQKIIFFERYANEFIDAGYA